jgi:cobalt-zinc-cadmium efflux system protein
MTVSGPASQEGHEHGAHTTSASADKRLLGTAFGLVVSFMAVEVGVGLGAHSLALLADAGHMLSDAGALAGALWALRLAARPVSARWSYGLKRAEILSAALNGVLLVAAGVVVVVEAIQRLLRPLAVAAPEVLAVALVGIGVNAAATLLLARANRSSLNIEGAFQHVLTDAAGFVATAAAAGAIMATGFRQADVLASLVVVALMAKAAWKLLRASGRILLEGTPENVDLEAVREQLLSASDHVSDVHDLHAWVLTSQLPAISAHVVVEDSCFADGHAPQILDALQAVLVGHFDVAHSTLQLEVAGHAAHETEVH